MSHAFMDERLIGTMKEQATFVAGSNAWMREKTDPAVVSTIEKAIFLLNYIGDRLEDPQVSGGTTDDPETILSLFWKIHRARQIFGVTVEFKNNETCRLSWSSPIVDHRVYDNLSIDDIIKINVPHLFKLVQYETHQSQKI